MSSVPEKEGLRATFHFVRWAHVHKGQWKIGLKKILYSEVYSEPYNFTDNVKI